MGDYTFGDEAEGIPAGLRVRQLLGDVPQDAFGFVGALVVGVPIGILMGRYRYAKNFFFDFVYLAANVPLIVYAILAPVAVRAR